MKTELRCPNCNKRADLAIKSDKPGKTVKVLAVHKSEKGWLWLRNTLLSKSYTRRLLRALGMACEAGE